MKKSELIEILNSIQGDPEVIMSRDAEGNSYSPCANYMHPAKYIPLEKAPWYGDIYNPNEDDQDVQDMCKDIDAIDAIVLWPTN